MCRSTAGGPEELQASVSYRPFPVHAIPGIDIRTGHDALAARIAQASGSGDLVVLDGTIGLEWGPFMDHLLRSLRALGMQCVHESTGPCFLPPHRIEDLLSSDLTDDPVFGRLFRGHLEDLWDQESLASLRERVPEPGHVTILSGFGASLVAPGDLTIYVDVPKDRAQELAAMGRITNLGAAEAWSRSAMYKRMYFIDWPALNRIKRQVAEIVDVFVDGTDATCPRLISGDGLHQALHTLAHGPFRVKPWFASGPWGGQWMKDRFGLPPEQPNYAWSFELIAPENGLVLSDGTNELECSFDLLLWQETEAVMGPAVAARYGSYFPIRFDYLDTMGGTNLSCQVHPRLDYIRDEFGEPFTQDETYYIVDAAPGSRVFLGLQQDADLDAFRQDAELARDQRVTFDIESYVEGHPAQPGDLFLIPSGTVHCSGAGNLVLEISATPYIYTFKIYDYLRADLWGDLRPVHIDRAFVNIDPARRGDWVSRHLRPEPRVLREGDGWAELVIGDIDLLFFAIHRLDIRTEIEDDTQGRFLALNLVAGERCRIYTAGNAPFELRFAESLVLPAYVGPYRIENVGSGVCRVVKAFVKT